MEQIKDLRNRRVSNLISQRSAMEKPPEAEKIFFGREKGRDLVSSTIESFLAGANESVWPCWERQASERPAFWKPF